MRDVDQLRLPVLRALMQISKSLDSKPAFAKGVLLAAVRANARGNSTPVVSSAVLILPGSLQNLITKNV